MGRHGRPLLLNLAERKVDGETRHRSNPALAGHRALLALHDDFEITIAPIDYLVQILQDVIGPSGGARMTGGGFGGCVVALMPNALVDAARMAVLEKIQSSQPRACNYLCLSDALRRRALNLIAL